MLPSEVEAAAVEAGISPEFVQLALAEQGGALDPGKELRGWQDRAATRILRTPERSVEVSRVIRAEPAAVLEAMQRLLPNHPYFLTLRDTVGDDPLNGAVLVFDVPSAWNSGAASGFALAMAYPDFKQLRIMIRPTDHQAGHCEVVISVDLRYSVWLSWIVSCSATGIIGAGGGVAGALAAGAMGLFGGVFAAAALGVAGLLLAGAATARGYGRVYRWGLKKGTTELEKLLQMLEANARVGGGFTPANPARRASLPSADG